MSGKPWHQDPPPPRRTAPAELAEDRPPHARQRGESLQAWKGFLAYLENSGSIRKAAAAAGKHRSLFARYSKRWRWVERKEQILASCVGRWRDLITYEERHNLVEAAKDSDELIQRELAAFDEIGWPRFKKELDEAMSEIEVLPSEEQGV